MIDIFRKENYNLQREELLLRIAQELQLNKTRNEKMESAYIAVSDLLSKDEFFKNFEIELYAQGSKRIGTTVKPINKDEFDLDIVCQIYDLYTNHEPEKIYNELKRVISGDPYYATIFETKKRCIRLNYKDDFHMDILPACSSDYLDQDKIAIPEKKLKSWSFANPKGYAKWFLSIAKSAGKSFYFENLDFSTKSEIETEPLPKEAYEKSILQSAVQLIKRYRDIYFENEDWKISSIVLTTLTAQLYNGEKSIFGTIDNVIGKIKNNYQEQLSLNKRFKIFNPTDNNEDFTEFWINENYIVFHKFISDFSNKWESLKTSFEESNENYIKLFGEGVYKKSLSNQVKAFGKNSSDSFAKANGLILTNSAKTNKNGLINETNGIKNEKHFYYGEK